MTQSIVKPDVRIFDGVVLSIMTYGMMTLDVVILDIGGRGLGALSFVRISFKTLGIERLGRRKRDLDAVSALKTSHRTVERDKRE
jgi:hypothetical protein